MQRAHHVDAEAAIAMVRALVDGSADAIVSVGPDGSTVTTWNPAAERMFGWSADEVVGRPLPTLPRAVEAGDPVYEEAVLAGDPSIVVCQHKDGSTVPIRIAQNDLIDGAGGRLGWIGVVEDVTDELAVARAREQRVQLAERLVDRSADLDRDLDVDAVLRRAVEAGVEVVKADAALFVTVEGGQPILAAVHNLPADLVGYRHPPGQGAVREVLETRRPLFIRDLDDYATYPMPLRHDSFSQFHSVVLVPALLSGQVTGVLSVLFSEIGREVSQVEIDALATLGQHAATSLANAAAYDDVVRRRRHEQAVVDALADGVVVVNRRGVVTQWNRSAAEMTGISAEDIVGHRPRLNFSLADGAVENRLDGNRWVEVVATPLPDTGETVLALRDITAHKAFEEAKSAFLAMTGHELKTPLTVIAGFTSTLVQRWDELDEEARRAALDAISRRSRTLARLVERLLTSSRVDIGELTVARKPFDLVPALRHSVQWFDDVSENHRLVVDLPETLTVFGDQRTVDQIVGQLIDNAVKYSPAGGVVRLEAGAHSDGRSAAVRVLDAGIGISEDEAAHVWDRFYQGGSGQRVAAGGVGLGLYVVRALVEAQGGSVVAYPCDEGPGSVFQFTLPLAASSASFS